MHTEHNLCDSKAHHSGHKHSRHIALAVRSESELNPGVTEEDEILAKVEFSGGWDSSSCSGHGIGCTAKLGAGYTARSAGH